MKENYYQSDVIVVGAGLAGLVATYELLEAGKKVLLIDRDEEKNIGGLAKWAFGGMFFVNTKAQRRAGFKDSVEIAKQDWYSYAEFDDSEYWGKQWADQYIHLCTPHSHDWLKTLGISFFPVVNWAERGLDVPGNSIPRFHMIWGTGRELTRTFIDKIGHHRHRTNLTTVFNHRVTDISYKEGRITGVHGMDEQNKKAFTARGNNVIVATGGINGSIEKVKSNWYKPWGKPPEVILNGSHKYAIGDLHEAVEKINGSVKNLDLMWNYAAGVHHPNPRKPDHGLSLVPCKSALWLNYKGERIGPKPLVSTFDSRYKVERICKQEKAYSWQVLNMKIAKKEFAISGSEYNHAIRNKNFIQFILSTKFGSKRLISEMINTCKDFVVADNLKDLVYKMNALTKDNSIQENSLRRIIHSYDSQLDLPKSQQTDLQIELIRKAREYRGDRVRTCKDQKIMAESAYPLIAIREFVLSRKSLGGIQTDLKSRVLTNGQPQDQEPVDGLYAVGEAAGFGGGGMHGKRALEGTFLGGCVITSRVAALHICGRALS